MRLWLERDPESYYFVPAETSVWNYQRLIRRGLRPAKPEEGKSEGPEAHARARYARCISACGVVGGHRSLVATSVGHIRPTLIRQTYCLEAVNEVRGHGETTITEIYAEHNLEVVMRIMRRIG